VNRIELLFASLIPALALGAGASVVWHKLRRQARLAARLSSVRNADSSLSFITGQTQVGGVAGLVASFGSAIARSRILSPNTVAGLEQTLSSTGLRGPSALGLFIGTKLLLLVFMPMLAIAALPGLGLSPLLRNVSIAGAALAGLLGPDWWIGQRYKRYLRALAQGLPDAMDLMVICAEAGLSFEAAITRVAAEIRAAHPAVSQELSQTANELRVAPDSRVALTNMGGRTGVEGIKRMAAVLAQTMKYGTPLSDALRVLSAEMRHEMLIRYETRAARLPVLLTIPMILFILPCIFLIVGGPAAIQVMKSFHP
jgi:tight adherence protein C